MFHVVPVLLWFFSLCLIPNLSYVHPFCVHVPILRYLCDHYQLIEEMKRTAIALGISDLELEPISAFLSEVYSSNKMWMGFLYKG